VRELVERYATALGSWPHVVATGGDAQALLGESDFVDSFVPDLVLQGAALVWEHSREGV
jgi:pantothenate kinase type III